MLLERILYKASSLPEPYDSEARFSLLIIRMFLIFITILGCMIAVIITQNMTISTLSSELAQALKNPAMIGLQDENGYFLSIEEIPEENILNWSHVWISNWKNNAPDTSEQNLLYAQTRMGDKLRQKTELVVLQKKAIVKKQGIETKLRILSKTLERIDKFEHSVTISGFVSKYIHGKPIGKPKKVEYVLGLCGVEPQASNPLALAVCKLQDPDIAK